MRKRWDVSPGVVFGRLTVVRIGTNRVHCRCVCGAIVHVRRGNLTGGSTRSCGCLKHDSVVAYNHATKTTHGETINHTWTSEYVIWCKMVARCTDPRSKDYQKYGGRGIRVWAAWQRDFSAFLSDVGRKPSSTHQLERVNNNRGYIPSNVKWATAKEQARNRRSSVWLRWRGERHTVVEWSELLSLSAPAIYARIRYGWTVNRILSTPVLERNYEDRVYRH